MSETVLLPEMLEAGLQALHEAQRREFEDTDTVISVYLAMQAIYMMAIESARNETRH